MIWFEKHKQLHELINNQDSNALTVMKEQAMNVLRSEKMLRLVKHPNTLAHKDIELIIELVVKIEAYESGLGWFARGKRRLSLTKEYAL